MLETAVFKAENPDVSAMAFSDAGELTQECTVLAVMARPMRTIIVLIPAAFALLNSDEGLSLGLPSVSMSITFGTPARPRVSTVLALRTAGTIYVPPLSNRRFLSAETKVAFEPVRPVTILCRLVVALEKTTIEMCMSLVPTGRVLTRSVANWICVPQLLPTEPEPSMTRARSAFLQLAGMGIWGGAGLQ